MTIVPMSRIITLGLVAALLASVHRSGNAVDAATPPSRPAASSVNDDKPTSANKHTVQKYMDAFRKSDHPAVLACLTDDIEWVIPGMAHLKGKAEFDKEIGNEAFVGKPAITVTRLVEEDGVVVAEGRVRSQKKGGDAFNAVFCDVFVLKDAKIRHLTSYLMEVKP